MSLAWGRAVEVGVLQGAFIWHVPEDDPRRRWLDWTGAQLRFEATGSIWYSATNQPAANESATSQSRANRSDNATLYGIGLQPILRWTFDSSSAGRLFVDFGTGPRLISETSIGDRHRFGTALEFRTVLGVGYERKDYDLFLRLEHTSNGSIREPNPGIDFLVMGLAWRLH